MGMIFQTKEQAERKKFEMQLEKKLKDFALENNEGEIDWNNKSQMKYYLTHDSDVKGILLSSTSRCKSNSKIFFTSQEIAMKALRTFNTELIRYFSRED